MIEFTNDYQRAMEAAGAKVPAFSEFGSYQGDWWAYVIHDGKMGYVHGSYGSCSGCDAFQSEFGWRNKETPETLAAFGKNYLEQMMPFERAIEEAAEHIQWDSEAENVVAWLKDIEAAARGQ